VFDMAPGSALNDPQAASYVRDAFPGKEAYFRVITLSEPPKSEMMDFLSPEHAGKATEQVPARIATVQAFLGPRDSSHFYELKVDLADGRIIQEQQLLGRHSHVDANDLQKCEAACLADPRVQEAIKAMELPENAITCVEPWTYGTDGMNDMKDKITMVTERDQHMCINTDNVLVLFLHATVKSSRRQSLRLSLGLVC